MIPRVEETRLFHWIAAFELYISRPEAEWEAVHRPADALERFSQMADSLMTNDTITRYPAARYPIIKDAQEAYINIIKAMLAVGAGTSNDQGASALAAITSAAGIASAQRTGQAENFERELFPFFRYEGQAFSRAMTATPAAYKDFLEMVACVKPEGKIGSAFKRAAHFVFTEAHPEQRFRGALMLARYCTGQPNHYRSYKHDNPGMLDFALGEMDVAYDKLLARKRPDAVEDAREMIQGFIRQYREHPTRTRMGEYPVTHPRITEKFHALLVKPVPGPVLPREPRGIDQRFLPPGSELN